MSKRNNTKTTETLTLSERIAHIEAARAEFAARCDKLAAASIERDERVTRLMGW